MNALCPIHDGRMPIGYEDIEMIESADFGVAHIVATVNRHEAPVWHEDNYKSLRGFLICEVAREVIGYPGLRGEDRPVFSHAFCGEVVLLQLDKSVMLIERNNVVAVGSFHAGAI
jgi:hypothetical protein